MYYPFFDSTWLIVLPGLLIAIWAQFKVKAAFSKYSKVASQSGMTGAMVARAMLDGAGLRDVPIYRAQGSLTDHYDPVKRTLNLSQDVYDSCSIAALGVAAHECGHAIQDLESYSPLKLRSAVVPMVSIGSNLSWPIFLMGIVFSWQPLLMAGIILFSLTVLFTLITLPVEFNASSRALLALESGNDLRGQELDGARKVLSAAALTYVAAALNAILQLLRLLALAGRHSRD